jgi:hypothetical protein
MAAELAGDLQELADFVRLQLLSLRTGGVALLPRGRESQGSRGSGAGRLMSRE